MKHIPPPAARGLLQNVPLVRTHTHIAHSTYSTQHTHRAHSTQHAAYPQPSNSLTISKFNSCLHFQFDQFFRFSSVQILIRFVHSVSAFSFSFLFPLPFIHWFEILIHPFLFGSSNKRERRDPVNGNGQRPKAKIEIEEGEKLKGRWGLYRTKDEKEEEISEKKKGRDRMGWGRGGGR